MIDNDKLAEEIREMTNLMIRWEKYANAPMTVAIQPWKIIALLEEREALKTKLNRLAKNLTSLLEELTVTHPEPVGHCEEGFKKQYSANELREIEDKRREMRKRLVAPEDHAMKGNVR